MPKDLDIDCPRRPDALICREGPDVHQFVIGGWRARGTLDGQGKVPGLVPTQTFWNFPCRG